eukprot:3371767-Prymnesium_polylepis.1
MAATAAMAEMMVMMRGTASAVQEVCRYRTVGGVNTQTRASQARCRRTSSPPSRSVHTLSHVPSVSRNIFTPLYHVQFTSLYGRIQLPP